MIIINQNQCLYISSMTHLCCCCCYCFRFLSSLYYYNATHTHTHTHIQTHTCFVFLNIEIGHNLGLAHSASGAVSYGDKVCTYICIYVSVCIRVCIRVRVRVCVCVCVLCIFIHISLVYLIRFFKYIFCFSSVLFLRTPPTPNNS